MLETVVIEPEQPARGAVIFLHGLGADGHDFEPIVPELGVDDLELRFVFPHAPERPITINEGEPLKAWYDFVPHSEHAGSDDFFPSSVINFHRAEAAVAVKVQPFMVAEGRYGDADVIRRMEDSGSLLYFCGNAVNYYVNHRPHHLLFSLSP